ncbi:MAG: OmpA family protein [Thermodesulfobacteriota bacterium]
MTSKRLLSVLIMWGILGCGVAVATEADDVNRVYTKLRAVLTENPDASPKTLAELVRGDLRAARSCSAQLKKRLDEPGAQGDAFRMLHGKLEEALFLAAPGGGCEQGVCQRLLGCVQSGCWDKDGTLFVLERLAVQCPSVAKVHHLLGDRYLAQRRAGMAIESYKRGLALKDDSDSRKLLEAAQEMMAQYLRKEPITTTSAVELMGKERTMAPKPGLRRKVDVEVAIQRQILFDEWSHEIRKEYCAELDALGLAFKRESETAKGLGLLIEGHTDRRGVLEENTKLSLQRAEAVKAYLVKQAGIEPSRITTQGYGPARPYDARDTPTGWELNRRVEFKKVTSREPTEDNR